MKLEEARPGMAVVYRARGVPDAVAEDGVVTSINERLNYVFVRFARQHPANDGLACRPEDLEAA